MRPLSRSGQRRQLDLDFFLAGDRAGESPFETIAVLDATSTSQTNRSPGSSPKTTAADCGTVVFSESDPATARNVLDSNLVGMELARDDLAGINIDLTEDLSIDLRS